MIKRHGIKYSVRRYKNLEKGFTQIPNDIFKVVETSYQLTIYAYLCYRYNRDCQYAFPSLRTIANDTHVSLSSVRRAIKILEEKGFIVIDKRKGKESANNYYIKYIK